LTRRLLPAPNNNIKHVWCTETHTHNNNTREPSGITLTDTTRHPCDSTGLKTLVYACTYCSRSPAQCCCAWPHAAAATPVGLALMLLRYACGYCYTCTWGLPRSFRFLHAHRDRCAQGNHLLRLHPLPVHPHGTLATCSICCNICLKTDETFRTYTCNIYVWPLQHMQHLDKTLATHV
jgi:hypothetical protein